VQLPVKTQYGDLEDRGSDRVAIEASDDQRIAIGEEFQARLELRAFLPRVIWLGGTVILTLGQKPSVNDCQR
jgi:hypothetical protein